MKKTSQVMASPCEINQEKGVHLHGLQSSQEAARE